MPHRTLSIYQHLLRLCHTEHFQSTNICWDYATHNTSNVSICVETMPHRTLPKYQHVLRLCHTEHFQSINMCWDYVTQNTSNVSICVMTKQHRTLSIYQYVWEGGLKFNSVDQINGRENRRVNQELAIQKNWQHWIHKTQDEDKQSKTTHMCLHHYTQTSTNNVN
jgi:hypothetical protein